MRTTVTLDADVEQMIREVTRRTGKSFKEVLNRAIREALASQRSSRRAGVFRVKARPMGLRPGLDAATLNRFVDELETDAFLEASRRRR